MIINVMTLDYTKNLEGEKGVYWVRLDSGNGMIIFMENGLYFGITDVNGASIGTTLVPIEEKMKKELLNNITNQINEIPVL